MKTLFIAALTLIVAPSFAQVPAPAAPGAPAPATAPAAQLSDTEIAKVLVTINEGEIAAGQMASQRAQNKDVKAFAKMMVDQHKKNESATKSLAKKQKMTLAESDVSKTLKSDAQATSDELKKTTKTTFDKAYMTSQVDMHTKALAMLNETLLPNVKNSELRTHLEQTRSAVEQHLDHAKSLDSQIH